MRAHPRSDSVFTRSERAAKALIADWMRKSGLDTKALSALAKEREREIERIVEGEKANATKTAKIAQAAVKERTSVLRALAKPGGFFGVPSFTLDKPVHISTTPRKILKSSRIKPFNSFAKFRSERTEEGNDTLTFHYEWVNKSDAPVAIDAITFVSGSGFFDMSVSGGFTFRTGFLSARAQLELSSRPGPKVVHEDKAFGRTLLALNMPMVPFDGHDAAGCHDAFNLTALRHPVAPARKVRIEVSLIVNSDCGNSFRSKVDFESGLLGVSCPLVVIRVHQVSS